MTIFKKKTKEEIDKIVSEMMEKISDDEIRELKQKMQLERCVNMARHAIFKALIGQETIDRMISIMSATGSALIKRIDELE